MKLWQGFLENIVLEAGNNVSWDVAEQPVDSEVAGLSEQRGSGQENGAQELAGWTAVFSECFRTVKFNFWRKKLFHQKNGFDRLWEYGP